MIRVTIYYYVLERQYSKQYHMLEKNPAIPSSSFKGFGNSRRHPYASSGEHFDFTAFINLCAAMVPGREPTTEESHITLHQRQFVTIPT